MSPFKCLFVISVLVCTVVTARRTIRSTNHYCLPLSQYQNPPNGINQCGRKECPRYTELNGHVKDLTNVTVRRVEAGVYATRTSTKCNLTDALIDSYLPLHYYFYGQEVRMNRTIPIMLFTTKMPAEHRCDYTHQLQFYLPLVNHTNYPDPTEESRVQVTAKQEECFVVYHWIGKITTQATYNNYFNLKTNLTDSDSFNLAYNENKFAHARYDPSCRPGARHEIWIPLDSCPSAESSSSD